MSLDDVQLHLVDDFETAAEFWHWCGTRDAQDGVGVDTETTGLIQRKDRVRLVQVGGATHGWAIPWERWSGLFEDFLRKWDHALIMHNAKFDHGMLDFVGVPVPTQRIEDTFVMSHVLEPHYAHGLKQQCERHVDAVAAGAQISLAKAIGPRGQWDWDTVPIDFGPYWQYAALDAVLTRHLRDYHLPTVRAVCPKAYELEMAVTWAVEKMENYGAFVDQPYARCKFDEFSQFVQETGAWITQTYGVKPGSNQAIVKLLEDEGHEFTKATRAGAKSLDAEVLEGIAHPLAEAVLNYRRFQKIANTYIRHFLDDVAADGCIHPSINTLGTRTGRMSMSDPNLQNLPRRSESNRAANIVRNCVKTRYFDGQLIMCDFGQIEMRLLAHMADEKSMIQAFLDEGDFFVNLARQIYDDPTIMKSDKRRQITKNSGYAKIYGAGVAKFALTAGITETAARDFLHRFDILYPGVREFQRQVDDVAWRRQKEVGYPYALSPLTGRLQVADTNKIYALVNYLIQGTAAEVLKMKIVECADAGLDEFMVVPVHDEIVLDVPGDRIRDVVHTLSGIMNDESLFSVPITASVSHGVTWGAKEDWVDG